MSSTDRSVTSIDIQGIHVDLNRRGNGRPILFLHAETGVEADAPVLDRLAEQATVYAPSHPGFGESPLPRWMREADDLAYFYLDLLDALDLRDVTVVGSSFGGWIAAEIAIKSTARIGHLILEGAAGIKVADREHMDFADMFNVSQLELEALRYHDPTYRIADFQALPEAALTTYYRNRETSGLFCWSPYMHQLQLARRLHRIRIPTLVVWGAEDRIVAADYGRAYAAAIPGAQFKLIAGAGHFPHIERAEQFASQVLAFAQAG